jgi:hypothetical protein
LESGKRKYPPSTGEMKAEIGKAENGNYRASMGEMKTEI